jgi:purine-binding chemotaxis protein CheW
MMDTTAPGNPSGQQDVLAFKLGRQTYALPIHPVVQIIEMVAITPIPQIDTALEGVINVHGEAVAVVKLRRHLGLPDAPLQLNTPIVLVKVGERTVGLIVDEVVDVLNLPDDRIIHLHDILPDTVGDAPALQGVTYITENTLLMLDPNELFDPQELSLLAQAVEILTAKGKATEKPPTEAEPKPTRKRRKAASPKKTSKKPPSDKSNQEADA